MALQRFLDSLTDVPPSHPFGYLERLNPSKYAMFYEDFLQFDFGDYPADSDAVALQYAITLDAELDYDVSFGGSSGALILTTEGGDTEGGQWRLNASPFQLTANKKSWFEAKFNVTAGAGTIGQESLFIGLSKNQTGTNFIDDAGTALAVDDAWGFVSYDAEAGVDAVVRDSDEVSTLADSATLVSGTNVVLSLYYDGVKTHVYKDSLKVGEISGTHPTADALTMMIHFKSQEAAVKVLTLDYVLVIIEK